MNPKKVILICICTNGEISFFRKERPRVKNRMSFLRFKDSVKKISLKKRK